MKKKSPVGIWNIKHKDWQDYVELNPDGKFKRLSIDDSGSWVVDAHGFIFFQWNKWGIERAKLVDDKISGNGFYGSRKIIHGLYSKEENDKLVREAKERVSGIPKKEVGVLFLCHKSCATTKRNLSSFLASNPQAEVVTINTETQKMPGYSLDSGFWNDLTKLNGKSCWFNMDAAYYEYYRRRKENCKRWLLAEWDVFCDINLKDFFGTLWDYPLVSTNVYGHGDSWYWFKDVGKLPEHAQRYASGCVPLAGTLVSDECLEKIVLESWWAGFGNPVFCELRFATLAKMAGYSPCPNPKAANFLRWKPRPMINGPGIWHPVKY